VIGKPTERWEWPDFFDLENSSYLQKMSNNRYNNMPDILKSYPKSCKDLLKKLLCWDPAQRITIHEMLLHPFFTEEPYPCAPESLDSLNFIKN